MNVNIREFNQDVYEYLNHLRERKSDLRYTYRKSNYGGRLEEGFWFYGNENYFCISFWSGMDWKNRTPNISFVYLQNGEARLEINVSDSDKKRQFVEFFMVQPLELHFDGRRYIKWYGTNEHTGIDFLNLFINGYGNEPSDKEKIDQIVSIHGEAFFNEKDNKIDFIDPYEFRSRDLKIRKYLDLRDIEKREYHDAKSKPSKLSKIVIRGYQDIKHTFITDLPKETQWIFLTGENGSGKTSVLKAITASLGYRVLDKKEAEENPNFEVDLVLYKGTNTASFIRVKNEGCNKRFPMVSALVTFGPNRLINQKDKPKKGHLQKALNKDGSLSPLWDFEYRMLDIEEQFDTWRKEKKKGRDELEKRLYFIRTLLSKVVPGLYDIRFHERRSLSTGARTLKTKYIVRKNESSPEEEKQWKQLPSGTRSVFAMVSEMLIRLYHFQKDVIDPSELTGIVIIDEIDLHLHPNAQRQLVIDLTYAFRNIQFIVATHSPIPLLGAPEGSVFIKISKDDNDGIVMQRLLEIEKNIGNLLPNILYTSSVFGMNSMISIANKNKKDVWTQDNNEEALRFQELKRKFKVLSIEDKEFIYKLKNRLKK
jgi:predicted ATPase